MVTPPELTELAVRPKSDSPPRALRGDGLGGRTRPFIVAACAALAVLGVIGHHPTPGVALLVAATAVAIAAAVFFVPWARLPRWTEMSVPTALVGMVLMLRLMAPDMPRVTSAPILLLAVLWVALYGTRKEVAFQIGAVLAAAGLEIYFRPLTPDGVAFFVTALLVVTVVALAVQQLMHLQRKLRAQVAAERDQLHAILARIDEGIALLDRNRHVIYANDACRALLGLSADGLSGLSQDTVVKHLLAVSGAPSLRHGAPRSSITPGTIITEYEVQRPTRRTLQRTCSPAHLAASDGYVVVWRDVTAERELQTQQVRLARTDALTGIANRLGIQEVLQTEATRSQRAGTPLSVAVFDVDRFKAVNDTFGHAVGDSVLRSVASTLTSAARSTDTVARWGGEEFLFVLPGSLGGAHLFCERARELVEAMELPNVGRVTVSIGITEYRAKEDTEATIARADGYLYEAKRSGRNRVIASEAPRGSILASSALEDPRGSAPLTPVRH